MDVAEGLDHFGVRFMSADFEWFDAWDSTQLAESGGLPRAASIEIAFLPEQSRDADPFEDLARVDAEDSPVYTRELRLAMEAIDLNTMLAAAVKPDGAPGTQDDFEDDEDLDEDLDDEDDDSSGDPSGTGNGSEGIPDDLEGLSLPPGITREQIESLLP